MNNFLLEIATSDFESTKNAVAGGADRIELCANLGEGGTTPSYGLIKQCREKIDGPIYPIIRIRGGDFLYTEDEYECMYDDAVNCKNLDCDGVVIGFLKADGHIDIDRTKRIVDAVYPLGVTFHRAFDRCKDPLKALEQIIDAGCERILTSGQQLTAPEGATMIARLNEIANGRIIIMPGSGVRANNVQELVQTTGCHQYHTSLRELIHSKMKYITPAFDGNAENDHYTVHARAVAEMRRALHAAG